MQIIKEIVLPRFALLILIALLTGCATSPNPQDPIEPYNRAMYKFNTGADRMILRPIARVYAALLPNPVQHGITNAFHNLAEPNRMANDLMQGNLPYLLNDTWRFIINSTVGLLGFFDVAQHIGLKTHTQDFGITLAHWGIKSSPYIMLPFLGPSTLRDTAALPIDYTLSTWPMIKPERDRYILNAGSKLNLRARLLPADKLVEQAFDPYVFIRDAYVQKRTHAIHAQKYPYMPITTELNQ